MGKFRLLNKREIDAKKAAERRMEIEEGSKLARRVDALRDTAATEETKLEAYRIQALGEIQAEIDPKLEEVRQLDREIKSKKDERERLSKPLTEWEDDLKKREALVQAASESLKEDKAALSLAIAANIQRERANKVESTRIADDRKETTEELVAAQKLHTDAKATLKDAREKSAIMNEALALREKEVTKRELTVSDQYRMNNEQKKRLDAYEAKVFKREQELKESWKVLIDTQKIYGQSTRSNPNDNARKRTKG